MDPRTRTLTNRWDAITATIDLIRRTDIHRGLDLARLDHEASYTTSPTGEGTGNAPSDPTAARAGRHHPPDPRKQLDQLAALIDWAYDIALTGDTNPRSRPTLGSPCKGGQTHWADEHGNCHLQSCGKRWPCDPAHPDHRWEPCPGVLTPEADRCPRCELHRDSWICRDCPDGADVHHRTEHARNGLCDRCRKRRERAQEAVA